MMKNYILICLVLGAIAGSCAHVEPLPPVTPPPVSSVTASLFAANDFKSELSLQGSRGETLSVVVKSTQCYSLPGINLNYTLSLYEMRDFITTKPSYNGAVVGPWKDPLLSSTQVCPPVLYLLDIAIDPASSVGAQVILIGDLKINLRVLNFSMPARPTLPLRVEIQPQALLTAHHLSQSTNVSVQGPLVLRYVQEARKHRIEPIKQMIENPPVKADGKLDLDHWSQYDASFRKIMIDGALAPVNIQLGTDFSNSAVKPSDAYLQAIERTAAEFGPDAWTYLWDEPHSSTEMTAMRALAARVKTLAPSIKVMVTTLESPTLSNLIDWFVPVFEQWSQFQPSNPGYWVYGSCMSHSCGNDLSPPGNADGAPDLMIDRDPVYWRAYLWTAFRLGAKEALYYNSTEAYGKKPDVWVDQYLFTGNGDGTLFYPLPNLQPGASLRMKVLRNSSFDVEYLAYAKAQDPGWLNSRLAALIPDVYNWSKNYQDFEHLRSDIIARFFP